MAFCNEVHGDDEFNIVQNDVIGRVDTLKLEIKKS